MAEKKKSKWKLIVALSLVVFVLAGAGGVALWLGLWVQYRDYSGEEYGVERYYSVSFPGFLLSELNIPADHDGLPVLAAGGLGGPGNGANLKKLTVAEGVKSINRNGFQGCKKLAEIVLPDSIRDIGVNAFEGTAYYENGANWENDALYIGKHLIKVKETASGIFRIKQGTISIADEAFTGSKITGVYLPSGLKRIGADAFAGCKGLEFHVSNIKDWAVIDKTYYDSSYSKKWREFKQEYQLFVGETLLESVVLNNDYFPEENTFEPRFVYANCTSLKSITVGDDWASRIDDLNGIILSNRAIKDVYLPCTREELLEHENFLYSPNVKYHFLGEGLL